MKVVFNSLGRKNYRRRNKGYGMKDFLKKVVKSIRILMRPADEKLKYWLLYMKLHENFFNVLASAVHILKLERYRED